MKLLTLTLIALINIHAAAQTGNRVGQTWKGPDISEIWSLLKEEEKSPRPKSPGRTPALKFTPAGDSGVTRALAEAFGSNDQQRAALVDAFTQIKQGYEAEVAKEGKSNNLAAAMTFFIASNVVTYHQTEMPADADTDKLFQSLENAMTNIPAFASMSNAEKHRMHDWLVCMGGFALTNYMDAKQNGNAEGLATIKDFAGYSMQLVLGIEPGKLKLSGSRLIVQGSPGGGGAGTVNNLVVGAWTNASAGTYGGVMRIRYIFNADGTYRFKSERSAQVQKWWTIEESGSFSINGDSLTIIPRTSKATLRNLNGVVQETRANALEKVTYKWTTHFFEGIGETNLVLEPPSPTNRDGVLGSNSLFPKAYLYTQGDKLEWRY
ncbi:MAG TPA: DUF6683 family protein [Pyrinomonadaceae bacterium]|nr:DUF6683 family protein [Pyrinomonadaceae bacterium]